jgi:hypothetical protein
MEHAVNISNKTEDGLTLYSLVFKVLCKSTKMLYLHWFVLVLGLI